MYTLKKPYHLKLEKVSLPEDEEEHHLLNSMILDSEHLDKVDDLKSDTSQTKDELYNGES